MCGDLVPESLVVNTLDREPNFWSAFGVRFLERGGKRSATPLWFWE